MKRYQVVTYSFDIGTDEKMDFSRFNDAARAARKYIGSEEYAAVYDRKNKIAYVVFGDIETPCFSDNITVRGL